ncbi:predicted protein [Uncinocarpus reesii 1704]|uniref:Uncharacterized protein n=1 Tax=Uncinocarpus reesii (strain UAMH 1704) TaxID=336963 RepID=C4JWB0_UNCRE|nr:uncharacterized protein UREG_06852 [Uncinocarpus reesii 1704]EEP81987.1 predicted protein [Uncinocarpus reesii 1704]
MILALIKGDSRTGGELRLAQAFWDLPRAAKELVVAPCVCLGTLNLSNKYCKEEKYQHGDGIGAFVLQWFWLLSAELANIKAS